MSIDTHYHPSIDVQWHIFLTKIYSDIVTSTNYSKQKERKSMARYIDDEKRIEKSKITELCSYVYGIERRLKHESVCSQIGICSVVWEIKIGVVRPFEATAMRIWHARAEWHVGQCTTRFCRKLCPTIQLYRRLCDTIPYGEGTLHELTPKTMHTL